MNKTFTSASRPETLNTSDARQIVKNGEDGFPAFESLSNLLSIFPAGLLGILLTNATPPRSHLLGSALPRNKDGQIFWLLDQDKGANVNTFFIH